MIEIQECFYAEARLRMYV